jgi:hypothetical protein
MEDNKEYDSKLLDSMEDICERENELLNKSNEENKVEEVEEKKEVKKKNKIMTKYYNDVKFSLIKYKNVILILLIYIIINLKYLEEYITNLLSRFKLSDNINYVLTNMFKGILFLLILYLLGIKVLF